jgi:hypothetical protein
MLYTLDVVSVCIMATMCHADELQGCLTAMYVPAGSDNVILRVGLSWGFDLAAIAHSSKCCVALATAYQTMLLQHPRVLPRPAPSDAGGLQESATLAERSLQQQKQHSATLVLVSS